MTTFDLDADALRKGWGSVDQYWFSLKDYAIRDASVISDMDGLEQVSQSAFFISLGYIPYFLVTNEEIVRAFVANITDKKLKIALSKIDDKNYVDSFWKYVNIYPQLSDELNKFEDEYVLSKAVRWCDDNGINYTVNI